MKTCRTCRELKPLEAFYSCHWSKDGVDTKCKKCKSTDSKTKRLARSPDQIKAARDRNRAWAKANPAKMSEYSKKYRESHPEVIAEYLHKNKERHSEYRKKWVATTKGAASKRACTKRQRKKFPLETMARQIVYFAVKGGALTPGPCERCDKSPAQAHHEDYSKPLDVVWLCPPCHAQRHKEIRMERSTHGQFS